MIQDKKTFDFHAGVRPLHSHPHCADGRNLETDASNSEGKGKPSLGSHMSVLWPQLSPLRKTHLPDLVGRRLKSTALQGERSP